MAHAGKGLLQEIERLFGAQHANCPDDKRRAGHNQLRLAHGRRIKLSRVYAVVTKLNTFGLDVLVLDVQSYRREDNSLEHEVQSVVEVFVVDGANWQQRGPMVGGTFTPVRDQLGYPPFGEPYDPVAIAKKGL